MLERLAAATRPGGWVVVHDLDNSGVGAAGVRAAVPISEELQAAFRRQAAAQQQLDAASGRDLTYGGRVYGALAGMGFTSLECESHNRVVATASAAGKLFVLNARQQREQLLETGHVSPEDLDLIEAATADPAFARWGAGIVVTSGQRPE